MRRTVLYTAVASASAILAFLAYSPLTCGYTDRARTSEMVYFAEAAKTKITEELKKNPHAVFHLNGKELIPDHINVKTDSGEVIEIAYREISTSGEIKMFSPQLGVMLVITPSVHEGIVSWSCWGRPNKKVPITCRE